MVLLKNKNVNMTVDNMRSRKKESYEKIETKEYILGIIGGCWILFFLLLLIWTKIEAQDLYNTNNITILMAVQIIWASYPFIFKLLNLDGTWNIILNLLISVINIALWIKFFLFLFYFKE